MIRRMTKRLLLAATAVLTIVIATTTPSAQAATLAFNQRMSPANNWQHYGSWGYSWCYSGCTFAIWPGFLVEGSNKIVIKPNSRFPKNKSVTFYIGAAKRSSTYPGSYDWAEILATYTLTRSGGTFTVPFQYYTYPHNIDLIVDLSNLSSYPLTVVDQLEYVELKKYY